MNERFRRKYGPWAVVTGASSGIGAACSRLLLASHINVVAVARREAAMGPLREIAAAAGSEVRLIGLDLAKPGSTEALAAATSDLDIGLLVAAAGFGTSGRFIDAPLHDELEMLEVNCAAVLRQAQQFGRRFAAQRRGGIILFGSLVGYQGVPGSAHYSATKAYVLTLGEALNAELAREGVDVLVSAPGPVRTGFEARANMRMGAAMSPEAVARETLGALGNRLSVAPGALSKLLTWSLAPLPRWGRVRIMAQIMGSMTAHQR